MTHPLLSIGAMSTMFWSFERDLPLWTDLGVRYAGLLASKFDHEPAQKFAQLRSASIRPSTVILEYFDLENPQSWAETHATHAAFIDLVAATGGHSIYFPPGRTTGAPWRDVLALFAEAAAPSIAYGKQRGVHVAMKPTLKTSISFVTNLRDSIEVAERTGVELIADIGNFWMERDTADLLIQAMPHIALVQITDFVIGKSGAPARSGRAHIGEGELPLRRLLREVLDAGYQGVFDLQVNGPLIDKDNYEPIVRRGVASASALLTELGL